MASIGDVDRNVTITFIGRDNASRAMTNIGDSASRTSKIVGGLVKVLKYAALAAVAALAAGAVLLAKGLYSATKAAYYDDIAMKKLAETQMRAQDATKAQAEATADYIDKMELATGIADDDLRPAMENLALTGMSVKESQEQLSLAADIAIAKNVSLTSASSALAKAYNGQLTGLSRLGIKVTKANGDALTLAETQKLLRDRFQGAAKAAGRTDPYKRLGAAFSQIKEEIGKEFLPMARKFATWIIEVAVPYIKGRLIPALKDLIGWIGDKLSEAADKIRKWWNSGGEETMREIWSNMQDAWKETKRFVDEVNNLVNELKDLIGNEEDASTALENLAGFFEFVAGQIKYSADNLERLNAALQWLKDNAASIQDAAGGAFGGGLLDWLMEHGGAGAASAKGGWLKRAQGGWAGNMTLVGEHGPELISNRGYVKSHSQSMGMGGAPVVINVNGAIDPVGTARQIRNILAKGDRASGRGALGLA